MVHRVSSTISTTPRISVDPDLCRSHAPPPSFRVSKSSFPWNGSWMVSSGRLDPFPWWVDGVDPIETGIRFGSRKEEPDRKGSGGGLTPISPTPRHHPTSCGAPTGDPRRQTNAPGFVERTRRKRKEKKRWRHERRWAVETIATDEEDGSQTHTRTRRKILTSMQRTCVDVNRGS